MKERRYITAKNLSRVYIELRVQQGAHVQQQVVASPHSIYNAVAVRTPIRDIHVLLHRRIYVQAQHIITDLTLTLLPTPSAPRMRRRAAATALLRPCDFLSLSHRMRALQRIVNEARRSLCVRARVAAPAVSLARGPRDARSVRDLA